MKEDLRFQAETLVLAGKKLLMATGSPESEADLVAERLVGANLAGHDSHGIIRLAWYMEHLRSGVIVPGAEPVLDREFGPTALFKGNRGYGQVIAEHAMKDAMTRAKANGMAGVGVTDLGHVGRLADYVLQPAKNGMVGLMFTSTGGFSKLVAPFQGKSRRMSTNPIAAAFPSASGSPVVMDMATSAYAEGKFRVLRDKKEKAPDRLLLDSEGNPTVDPEDFYAGGAILPLGGEQGYKGYLLNFLVEVLGGLLTGGGFLGKDENPVFNNCSLMVVLDVKTFRPVQDFQNELQALMNYLKSSPVHPGQEVLNPGEVEARKEAERRTEGIPLALQTVETLQGELEQAGVAMPLAKMVF